jgi:hypothetical protein
LPASVTAPARGAVLAALAVDSVRKDRFVFIQRGIFPCHRVARFAAGQRAGRYIGAGIALVLFRQVPWTGRREARAGRVERAAPKLLDRSDMTTTGKSSVSCR